MARYEHLPIFKNAYDLALDLDKRVHGFSRFLKYSIGDDLRTVIREALQLIIKANNMGNKLPVLLELRWQLEYLKVLLRLAHDSGAFPTGKKRLFLRRRRPWNWPGRTRAGLRHRRSGQRRRRINDFRSGGTRPESAAGRS